MYNNIINIVKQTLNDYFKDKFRYNIHTYEEMRMMRGHMSSNAPLIIQKKTNTPIDVVHSIIQEALKDIQYIDYTFLKNGFLNIIFKDTAIIDACNKILSKEIFMQHTHNNQVVLVEAFSVNPTGDIHIGHTRAICAQAIVNILRHLGYKVDFEYFVNDAGNQIDVLAQSIWSHISKDSHASPAVYNCKEVQRISKDLQHMSSGNYEDHRAYIKEYAVNHMMLCIKKSLLLLNIKIDNFFYEASNECQQCLHSAFSMLKSLQAVYEMGNGCTMLKTVGDDDRVLIKSNGEYTYFAGDIGYHFHKIQRGYSWLINFLGADHIGYIPRIKTAVHFLSSNIKFDIKIYQMMSLYHQEKNTRFSKRNQNIISIKEALNHIDRDTLILYLLSQKLDTHMSCSVDKLSEYSETNKYFLIVHQYQRILKIIDNLSTDKYSSTPKVTSFIIKKYADLINLLITYDIMLADVCDTLEVHHIVEFLRKVTCHHTLQNLIDGQSCSEAINFTEDQYIVLMMVHNTVKHMLGMLGLSS